MVPLYEDLHFTSRSVDVRFISQFRLEDVEAGRQVSMFTVDHVDDRLPDSLQVDCGRKATGLAFLRVEGPAGTHQELRLLFLALSSVVPID
jgi:hypothetical protein